MANVYVRSGAAGGGTGADWANAFTTLAAALAAKAAGDDFWVSEDHAESVAGAAALTSPGTAATPCRIICVNHAGTVPPASADLATTGSVATTGASTITFSGYAYCYGLSFTSGSVANLANIAFGATTAYRWKFEACKFIVGNTNSGSLFLLGGASAVSYDNQWVNCTVKFGAVGQSIAGTGGTFTWKNTASAVDGTGSTPTNLITSGAGRMGAIVLSGVDLSQITATKITAAAIVLSPQIYLKDCKLGAAPSGTLFGTPATPGPRTFISRSDSSGTNYIEQLYAYEGTQTDETTIVRTNGATDGTTAKSRKIVTTANTKWYAPFEAPPLAIWNDVAGSSVTVTVYGIWGGGAVPNNDDVWIDAEYLGASGNPLASFALGSKANALVANSAQPTDASVWGGSTTAFKMTLTFTPQQKGLVYIYPKVAAASTTLYIDPQPVLS